MAQRDEHYIDRVQISDLDQAVEDETIDKGTEALLRAEMPEIQAWRDVHHRPPATRDNLTGLALSGGGIRSATFCLGVIQALVKHDLFKRFDYLSTVSGGGYIGSSITWLTSKTANDVAGIDFGVEENNFPYGTDDPTKPGGTDNSEQKNMLKYLRQHGNYLVPGNGITIKSAISVVLRGIVANFLVWLPILAAVFFGLFWLGDVVSSNPDGTLYRILVSDLPFQLPLALIAVFIISSVCWFKGWGGRFLKWLAILTAVWLSLFAVSQVVDQTSIFDFAKNILNNKEADAPKKAPNFDQGMFLFNLALQLFLALVALFVVYSAFYSLMTCISTEKLKERYSLRRTAEKGSGNLLWWALLLLVFGTIPYVDLLVVKAGGIGAVALGAAAGVWSFLRSGKSDGGNGGGVPRSLIAPVGATLFLYGMMLITFRLGHWVFHEVVQATPFWTSGTFRAGAAMLVIAVIIGLLVNLNYMTIHRFYRDRLMETFMPNIGSALKILTGPAEGADQGRLHVLWRQPKGILHRFLDRIKAWPLVNKFFAAAQVQDAKDKHSPRSPYHIVNANLMLVNSDTRRYRIRGGDNFILSPLYCGSNATGWRRTTQYLGGDLTLATAMAISGAAANPNTGVGGAGLTRKPAISVLMGLLDIRLGYWVRRPRKRKSFRARPNHFEPGFFEFINKGLTEKHKFLQISDGGHFENLALYELIRRRARLIVCCDAGADRDASFGDLQVTLRRIGVDFGAEIEFDNQNKPENLVPSRDAGYPKGAQMADQGHIVGTITYADGTPGTLILLKTTLVPDLRLQVLGYKSSNPAFPDQSTADQFFDEDQFEAYRELGYVIGDRMIRSLGLGSLITQAES